VRRRSPLSKAPELPERLGWRDYFQIAATAVMLPLGAFILCNAVFVRWTIPSFIFGVAFLLYSLFRVRMIWNYFQQRAKRHGI
jgi:hypothetical protein